MMVTINLICLLLALVCFCAKAIGVVTARVDLLGLGLTFLTLSFFRWP
jgi:hypothetical protein